MDDLIKTFPSLGVGGALASLIFYFYRKQGIEYYEAIKAEAKRFEDFMKYQNDLLRTQNDTLVGVIKENSRASATLSEVVRSLHEHLIFDQKLNDRRDVSTAEGSSSQRVTDK